MVAGGLLNIKTEIKAETKVPTYEWKWEEFLDLCELDEDSYQDTNYRSMTDNPQQHGCGIRSENFSLGSDDSHDDFDEFWDNSKEQYELTTPESIEDLWYRGDSLTFHSSGHFISDTNVHDNSQDQSPFTKDRRLALSSESRLFDSQDLTSEPSDDEVFPIISNGPLTRSSFKRQQAFRRRQRTRDLLENNIIRSANPSILTPTSPNQVNTTRSQNLSYVLSERRPIVPETVNLQDNGALYLDSALLNNAAEVARQKVPAHRPYLRPPSRVN